MAAPKDPDPLSSPRAFYGSELRRLREAAGLSQEQLGGVVFCSGAYIGQIEAAVRRPQEDMSERLDEVLGSDGLLLRLCRPANKSPHAEHFADAAEWEQHALTISAFAPTLITGLLQTEGYSRAVFEAGLPWASPSEIEDRVRARSERAKLLYSPTRPKLWAILHESALRLPVGGPEVMREQLTHIIELARERRIIVQVLPTATGAHALIEGPLYLMTFADAPPVAYVEGVFTGNLLDDPAMVAAAQRAYDCVRAMALSPCDSLSMMERLAEEFTQ
ncbi:helix-turn-helix domain-containing protein [Yinghuangia sp. YIM S10712]|uniref:helix-turn-helix domain-containing protein n=1 Tax=Yinghuangia sp. YIM S10712 TaxID=3436930 RepID=UPI003F52C6F5